MLMWVVVAGLVGGALGGLIGGVSAATVVGRRTRAFQERALQLAGEAARFQIQGSPKPSRAPRDRHVRRAPVAPGVPQPQPEPEPPRKGSA